MRSIGALLAVSLLTITGCTHVISEESMRLVDRSITFQSLKAHPDQYLGHYVLLGGAVATVNNAKQAAQMEVVEFKLDSDSMPDESYSSGGRFLAQTGGFLDPLVYKSGRLVTIVGEVKGHKSMPIDQVEYDYPIVAIREIHLWRAQDTRYYPYPYYYPYYPYDYWWRPYRPWPYRW